MKRIFVFLAALAALYSCMPSTYTMYLDVKYPSSNGTDVEGKSVSVVFCYEDVKTDSAFLSIFSDGLAKGIEEGCSPKGNVDVFSMAKSSLPGDIASRETAVELLMGLGCDAICLVDAPSYDKAEDGKKACHENVYFYDSMDKNDKVVHLKRFARMSDEVSLNQSDAEYFGYGFSEVFKPEWKSENETIVYYDNLDSRWNTALSCAASMDWQGALNVWLQMVDLKSLDQRANVCYNIAMSCYLMDNLDIALEWLDRADVARVTNLSSTLRKKIAARKK